MRFTAPSQQRRLCTAQRLPALQQARHGRAVVCQATATISEARKLLARKGWQRAWIDQATERINRETVFASKEEIEAVIDTLEEIGFDQAQIEHVCTIAWALFDAKPENIKAVFEYVKQSGTSDPLQVIFHNPKLLEYEVKGDELAKGRRGRAKVTIDKSSGDERLLVSWYAANAAFGDDSAPIAPWDPMMKAAA